MKKVRYFTGNPHFQRFWRTQLNIRYIKWNLVTNEVTTHFMNGELRKSYWSADILKRYLAKGTVKEIKEKPKSLRKKA